MSKKTTNKISRPSAYRVHMINKELERVLIVLREHDPDGVEGLHRYSEGESDAAVAKRLGETEVTVAYRRREIFGAHETSAPLLNHTGDYAELRAVVEAVRRTVAAMDERITALETQRAVAQAFAVA